MASGVILFRDPVQGSRSSADPRRGDEPRGAKRDFGDFGWNFGVESAWFLHVGPLARDSLLERIEPFFGVSLCIWLKPN